MRAIVLGAAAGGGFPQWNCGCRNCRSVRAHEEGFLPRTQCSLAVTGDGSHWAVLDASPDIREQINRAEPLRPTGPRNSPIASVLVTSGDVDHVAGLLSLREKQPFDLFLTREIASLLKADPIFAVLDPAYVRMRPVELDEEFELVPGVPARLFPAPGKVPLYLEEGDVTTDIESGQTVGVAFGDGLRKSWYIPGCGRMTETLGERLRDAETVFFDGTLWSDDEMIVAGLGPKTGRRMGHMPMSGAGGSIEAFSRIRVQRKVYIHINNSNPVLDPNSRERRMAEAAGWKVGFDEMEIDRMEVKA